ncbi:rhodanese-like domain-containing protein [Apiospora hydei]|uniref:Sulfurtransferase n=1 Tax=Apiospora hydei TaxID=1337664 RepID=A0ABR1W862_9PEZI
MASKSLQTLSTQTLLRASSRASPRAVRCIASPAAARLHSSSSSSRAAAVGANIARPQLLPSWRPNRVLSGSVRWSSESATGSKIWSFEEIQSLPQNVTLIDVREPSELASTGRIPGALNIPITTSPDSFHISAEEFEDRYGFARPQPDEDEVVFYCKAGVRSRAAAGIAREAGWKKVGEYPGSWVEWSGKGGRLRGERS